MADRLLKARLADAERAAVRSSSAGVRALAGHPMDPLAADVLRKLGGEPDGHVARQISPAMVHDADLVLTASTDQRSRVVRDYPAAMRRTFTLLEFARLGAELGLPVSGGTLQERVGEVAGQRGIADPVDATQDEIGDPFGASREIMWACGVTIAEAVDAVARILGFSQDG